MENEVVPDEVKIIHIHKGNEEKNDFIEFMLLQNGKTALLRVGSFIKRYGSELVDEFRALKTQ